MSAKWTPEQRAKFMRTMAAKREAAGNAVLREEEDRLRGTKLKRRPPNDATEFAKFMAAAWKLYRRG